MGEKIIDKYVSMISNKPDLRIKKIAEDLMVTKDDIRNFNSFIKADNRLFKEISSQHQRFVNESCVFVTENADVIDDFLHGRRVYPLILEIHPGPVCNYNCVFCFSNGDEYDELIEHNGQLLKPDKFDEICRDCKKNDVREMWFSGGKEPLTNKNAIHFIETANYYGFVTRLYTNGVLLNPSEPTLADCSQIRISINAAQNETYMKICGVNKISMFGELIDTIKDLVERKKESDGNFKAKIAVSFLIQKRNIHEMYDFFDKFSNIGVDSIQFRLDSIGRIPKLSASEMNAVIRQASDIVNHSIKNNVKTSVSLRGITEGEFNQELLPGLDKPNVCLAGMIKRGVSPFSSVFFCEYASHPHFKGESKKLILGNVNEIPFGEIMANSLNKFPPVCKFCQAHEYGMNVLLSKLLDDLEYGFQIKDQIFYRG